LFSVCLPSSRLGKNSICGGHDFFAQILILVEIQKLSVCHADPVILIPE